MAIVINKAAVRRSLDQWFIAARAGHTLGAVETAKLSSADAAAQSSDFVFELLANDEDSFQYEEPAKAGAIVNLVAAVDIAAGAAVVIRADGSVSPADPSPVESSAPVEDFFG